MAVMHALEECTGNGWPPVQVDRVKFELLSADWHQLACVSRVHDIVDCALPEATGAITFRSCVIVRLTHSCRARTLLRMVCKCYTPPPLPCKIHTVYICMCAPCRGEGCVHIDTFVQPLCVRGTKFRARDVGDERLVLQRQGEKYNTVRTRFKIQSSPRPTQVRGLCGKGCASKRF